MLMLSVIQINSCILEPMKKLFASVLLGLSTVTILSPTVLAAKPSTGGKPSPASTPLGIDVSWPQCGKRLPTDQAFGIVGVNGGLANNTNPCLKDQLVWASKSKGGTIQDKVQLYVNTANPADDKPSAMPTRSTPENPYPCDASDYDSIGCAWQYGWDRAYEDVYDRFIPAATQAGISNNPSDYIWWLDVETENSWKLGQTSYDHQRNAAVLEAMTQMFTSIGGRVGLYSTASQWGTIIGDAVGPTSNLLGLDNWRPGGASQSTAAQACGATPLTSGGRIVLTQFVSKNLDYNYPCIR